MTVTCDPHLLQSVLEARESPDVGNSSVGVIARLADPRRSVQHLETIVRAGSVVTGRVLRTKLLDVRADPNVLSLKRSRQYMPPDLSAVESTDTPPIAAPPGRRWTGRGVIVGIADWGFDVGHRAYRRTPHESVSSATRFLHLWDQRDRATGEPPHPYGYGCEFSREDIDAALRSGDPYAAMGYDPASMDRRHRGMHGTHALGIACAGREGANPGVAPDAEIIAVHLRGDDTAPEDTLGDSARILEAIDYILTRASERPVVISLSLGRTGGPHDASPLIVQGIDALLGAAPGRAIVMSAGNYFATAQHASSQLTAGVPTTWRWSVEHPIGHVAELEIWYRSCDTLSVELHSPDGTCHLVLDVGDATAVRRAGSVVVSAYHRANEPNSDDSVVDLFVWPGAPAGDWTVRIHPRVVWNGEVHGWIERVSAGRQSRFVGADPCFTTNSICNGSRTIAVAACDTRSEPVRSGHFSSAGPTRDLRLKPDVAAPGVAVLAPKSTVVVGGRRRRDESTTMSGTSMAAPYVAGAVALMFEAARRPLWASEICDILRDTAQPVTDAPVRVGHGLIDIDAAIERTIALTRSSGRRLEPDRAMGGSGQ